MEDAALAFVTMVLVRFLYPAERGVIRFHYYDWQMDKEVEGCSSHFLRTFIVAWTMMAFGGLSSGALLIQPWHIWRIVAQHRLIGRLRIGYFVGFHTSLKTAVNTSWSMRLFRYGTRRQMGHWVWMNCMMPELSSEWYPLRTIIAWGALLHSCIHIPEQILKVRPISCFA